MIVLPDNPAPTDKSKLTDNPYRTDRPGVMVGDRYGYVRGQAAQAWRNQATRLSNRKFLDSIYANKAAGMDRGPFGLLGAPSTEQLLAQVRQQQY